MSKELGYDLVEVAPMADPPVCRIIDYGKFKYEQKKKMHQAKKHQSFVQVKEVKLRPSTDEHDFQIVEPGETGEDRRIVTERLVAVQLDEFVKQQFDIVECLRPRFMPRDLDDLPGAQLRIDLALETREFQADSANQVLDVS